jgi:hypothetical protein
MAILLTAMAVVYASLADDVATPQGAAEGFADAAALSKEVARGGVFGLSNVSRLLGLSGDADAADDAVQLCIARVLEIADGPRDASAASAASAALAGLRGALRVKYSRSADLKVAAGGFALMWGTFGK